MADIQEARVVGDWRRIVGDYISSHEGADVDDIGVNGTVTLTPTFSKGGPQGVLGSPDAFYSPHTLTCKVLWGQLHDGDLNNPWQDIVVSVDGNPLVWTAAFSLTYKARPDQQPQKIVIHPVTFDHTAIAGEQISLTSLIPVAQVPPAYQSHFVNAQASAAAADTAKGIAVGAAAVAVDAVEAVEGSALEAVTAASTATDAATLAGQEADRAIGLSTAQDEHVADVLSDDTSLTHAAFKAVGNATYGTRAEVRARAHLATPAGTITEQTTALQAAITDAAAAGAPLAIRGDFSVNNGLTVPGKTTLDGRHGKITQTDKSRHGLRLADGATGVRLLGLTLRGDPSFYTNTSAVYSATGVAVPAGAGDVKVWECDIRGFAGAGVRALPGAGEVNVQWCTIVGPDATLITSRAFNYGAGLGFPVTGSQWSAEFNDISGYAQGIVTADGQKNFRIIGNRIHDIPGQHGMYLEQVNNGVIANNVVWNTGVQGMKIQIEEPEYGDSNMVSIHDNVFRDTGSTAILLTEIRGNPIRHVGFTIHDNLIRNAAGTGIHVLYGTGGNIHDNVIDGTTHAGLHVRDSTQFSVHHNRIRNAGLNGLQLENATDFEAGFNRVINPVQAGGTGLAGIRVERVSSNGVLRGNRVSDSTGKMAYGVIATAEVDLSTMEFYDNRATGATAQGFRASSGSVPVRGFRGNHFEGAAGPYSGRPSNFPLNEDTTGATLAALETEINELKATLRTHGLIAT